MTMAPQKKILPLLIGAVGTTFALGTQQAFAMLEETIVTAQKREQSAQDVPIAMQAFSGDQLKEQGINQIIDIVDLTPNMTISGQSASNRQINIRGVGTSGFFPNASGSVGIYMDAVTMSAPYLTS